MSVDGKYYDIIHLDETELDLLMRGLDAVMEKTRPILHGLKWSYVEARVLRDKLEEVKNGA